MTYERERRFASLTRAAATTIAVAALTIPASMAAQTPALLAITSPANGAVISPGQTVNVTVTSPANALFDVIGLIGTGGIGIVNAMATAAPAQFSVAIPADMACRTHTLTARGRTTAGQDASAEVDIDVEKPDVPWSLSALLRQIIFDAQGDSYSIGLLGTFADGSVLDVTESSNVTYSSSNAGVATVEGFGLVTAVAPGKASIVAMYGPPGQDVRLTIPITVPSLRFGMSPGSLDFGEQQTGTSSSQQFTLTNTTAAPLDIFSVTTDGDFAETDDCVSSSPLALGAACIVTVTFAPTSTGIRTGSVSVTNGVNDVAVVFKVAGIGQ
jgi:hypothetical protein